MAAFDPWGFGTTRTKHWGWLYALIAFVPFFIVLALTFYVLSLLLTDEDLYYKKQQYETRYTYSTLSAEFSNIKMVAEIVPHFILTDEDDKYVPLEFVNHTYYKNVTFTDGEKPKERRFEELYHTSDATKGRLPPFIFKDGYVPLGDSRSSCLHVRYRSKNLPLVNYVNFTSLRDMPECYGHKQEIWNKEDPTHGINLLVWKEFASQNKPSCQSGVMKKDICYEYTVMTKICIIVRPYNSDPTQGWIYKEGCYDGGSAIQYEKAQPGREYRFEKIPVEIWTHKGPFYEFESSLTAFGADLSYFGWLSRMCWVL
jgi:hypothetical protein